MAHTRRNSSSGSSFISNVLRSPTRSNSDYQNDQIPVYDDYDNDYDYDDPDRKYYKHSTLTWNKRLFGNRQRTTVTLLIISLLSWTLFYRPVLFSSSQKLSSSSRISNNNNNFRWGLSPTYNFRSNPNNPISWGDWIALGNGRQKLHQQTDPNYSGLGDDHQNQNQRRMRMRKSSSSGTLIRYSSLESAVSRRRGEKGASAVGGGGEAGLMDSKRLGALTMGSNSNELSKSWWGRRRVKSDSEFGGQGERHGIYGGDSVEWKSGLVGLGEYFGPVDMRKKSRSKSTTMTTPTTSSSSSAQQEEEEEELEENAAKTHMIQHAWKFDTIEEEKTSNELQSKLYQILQKQQQHQQHDEHEEEEETNENPNSFFSPSNLDESSLQFLINLPTRDKVRNMGKEKRMEAVELWEKIYGAYTSIGPGLGSGGYGGRTRQSALEETVKKLVRKNPVVIFSKTTCPFSKRAKQLLKKYHLSPEPYIVEVDLRPDSKSLKTLLTRLTNHSTFPNIIIGGKSFGGFDELERLERRRINGGDGHGHESQKQKELDDVEMTVEDEIEKMGLEELLDVMGVDHS